MHTLGQVCMSLAWNCLYAEGVSTCKMQVPPLNVCSHKQMCNVFPLVSVQVCQNYHFNSFMSHPSLVWSRISNGNFFFFLI